MPNASYRDWGWINGLGHTEFEVFAAERKRHDKEMQDGIGEHHAKYTPWHDSEEFECSCGFAWKMDFSG